ncbi:hypothetical protein KPE82_08275 [Acinetobacter baumannii]|uniref:hypothetical protein n=1 Tax=Acinetobacter baumannii TaxID=470 RepID=UPI001C0A9604|nr:hypothetical protein [Acinetobacter baumannii]MBU3095604.1 hypothetical protein [Acinetobacter baumannii]
MSLKSIKDYYSALNRLINDDPIYVEKGSKINFDTVALEAGRGRGAIKGNSQEIITLKIKIKEAQLLKEKQSDCKISIKKNIDWKIKYMKLKDEYLSLKSEQKVQAEQLVSVIFELAEMKKKLAMYNLDNDNLINFRK